MLMMLLQKVSGNLFLLRVRKGTTQASFQLFFVWWPEVVRLVHEIKFIAP